MKKSIRVSKKAYILAVILALLVTGTFMVFGKALVNEFTFDIDQFNEDLQASPDDCWKKPAQNRKDTVSNKLTELQQLITEENFEDAYSKLLHDIKPKLTGLKQDEYGDPWGNGVYEKVWVTCDDLRVFFDEECNLILSQINPLSVYDDDKTPPSILIQYEGEGHIANPGVWHVDIEDLESGLDMVVITVNEIAEVYDLQGEFSIIYDVPVPAIAQINMIEVIVTNDDKDYAGDQETSTESDWVEIFADVTSPTIVPLEDVEYEVGSTGNTLSWIVTDENPETYEIFLEGASFESGVWISGVPISIGVDGFSLGSYQFSIEIYDSYSNYATDTVNVVVVEDDDTSPPTIIIHYWGANDINYPGIWIVVVEDLESGIDEVQIIVDGNPVIHDFNGETLIDLDVNVPGTLGVHTIEVIATNNDNDWENDQETFTKTRSDEIGPFIPPPPPIPPPDTSPPVVSLPEDIEYEYESTGNSITWTATDAHPNFYQIHMNGELFMEGFWESGVPIEVWVDGLAVGIYEFAIICVDTYNNIATDSVFVTVIEDDDISPPTIVIYYLGGNMEYDAGVWIVVVEDLESGIDEIQILVDGILTIHDFNGETLIDLDVNVPGTVGVHTIEVVATNNDKDGENDQETFTKTRSDEIEPFIPPPPPI